MNLDAVTLQILWSRLIGVADECWLTIARTAFSLIISESYDFGCELLDAQGNSIAHSPQSMPAFNLTLPNVTKRVLETFRAEERHDGDVFITNDPWLCAGHLFDLAIVTPVFREQKLIGFVGSVAHCSDIGGIRDSLRAREIYDEGLQIPMLKLYREGHENGDLLAVLAANVRSNGFVLGDVHAQVTSNRLGVARVLEIIDEYELDDLEDVASEVQRRSETAMRAAIRAVPDGEYRHSVTCDAVGEPITLTVRITVSGERVRVEWVDVPSQVPVGGMNCTLSYLRAHCMYVLKCVLTPETPSNAGCFRSIEVDAPAGSVLNCSYPAAVNMRTMVGWYCAPALLGALAQVLPERVQAFTALPMWIFAYGNDAGSTFNDHLAASGGQGAGSAADGKSALLFPTSAANTSVEMFESRTGLLVEYKELRPDSGGAGRHRGGLGCRFALRKLHDDGNCVLVGFTPNGCLAPAPTGLHEGSPGAGVVIALEDGSARVCDWSLNGFAELSSTTQRLVFELGGGSGYGPASERPLAAIAADLAHGYITEAGLAAYGRAASDLAAPGVTGGP